MMFNKTDIEILEHCLGGFMDNEHDKGCDGGHGAELADEMIGEIEKYVNRDMECFGLLHYVLEVFGENLEGYIAEFGDDYDFTKEDIQDLRMKFEQCVCAFKAHEQILDVLSTCAERFDMIQPDDDPDPNPDLVAEKKSIDDVLNLVFSVNLA